MLHILFTLVLGQESFLWTPLRFWIDLIQLSFEKCLLIVKRELEKLLSVL